MAWEEYIDTVQACRERVKKIKAHLGLNLLRDIKGSKKDYCRFSSSGQKTRANSDLLLNGIGMWTNTALNIFIYDLNTGA